MQIPLVEPFQYEQTRRLVTEYGQSNQVEQIRYLRGVSEVMRALSCYCAEQGVDPDELSISEVRVGGTAITTRWRRHLESLWNARVREVFGATEFYQSYATECLDCGWYHYQLWSVYPEVIPFTDEPADSSTGTVGELVMSHLVPFALRQPLIRYRTGDLVQRGGLCPTTGHQMYRFGGRLRNIVLPLAPAAATIEEATLTSCQVKEVVDGLPGVARTQDAYAKAGFYQHNTFGDALWRLRPVGADLNSPNRVVFNGVGYLGSEPATPGVEIGGNPAVIPPADEIHQMLRQCSPALRRWEDAGLPFTVKVVDSTQFAAQGAYV